MGSLTTSLLKRCIVSANFHAVSNASFSSSSNEEEKSPLLASSTRPFQRTLSTTMLCPPFLRTRSLDNQASTYSSNRFLSVSTKTISNGTGCCPSLGSPAAMLSQVTCCQTTSSSLDGLQTASPTVEQDPYYTAPQCYQPI
jgi:adhesin HecA-like repeat protein